MNNTGAVAFRASLTGGRASSGIFVSSGGVITPVVLSGQVAPGTGGGRFSNFGAPSINDHGSIVFQASIEGGSRGQGLFIARNGTIRPIALTGEIAPGTAGKTFISFFQPLINNNDAVAFQATLPSRAPNPFSFEERLFLAVGDMILPVALQGQEAPGTGGGIFSRFSPDVRIIQFPILSPMVFTARFSLDDSNAVAFTAEVTGGTVASAIFLATPTERRAL
ncbi:MAG: hypothetical protein RMM98_11505 [Acidobacteriota bacterium]|nr:hypothetical protein [Blastocatellia bacterium]MDW8240233.1 hypothetical protein [Acidobacteriota bacterium]